MSFFGFNTALPRDRGHQSHAPGFGAPQDAFAGLGSGAAGDDDALDFEDTYDGLADHLDEGDDVLNDDTFGEEPATQQSIGRDFDFSGQTAKVSNTLQEEHILYQARQPPPRAVSPPKRNVVTKPAATGYEKYKAPEYIPSLQANANLWGLGPKKTATPVQSVSSAPASRKMMSLEEVEAMMRGQGQQQMTPQPQVPSDIPNVMSFLSSPPPPQQLQQQQTPPPPQQQQQQQQQQQFTGFAGPPHILQRPQQAPKQSQPPSASRHTPQAELPAPSVMQQPQILQRQHTLQQPEQAKQTRVSTQPAQAQVQPPQPRQILQNPNRLSGHGQPLAPHPQTQPRQQGPIPASTTHRRGPSYQGQVVTDPHQIMQLSDAERAQFLADEAKRAKRNHKIHMLSKDNGLMTPQDKNFITRIQLQQLVTATGNVDENAGSEAMLTEDFYYQVYTTIRGATRQNPNQPANQFAQTYLFATHGRYGRFGQRGHHNRGDNHMQRMEQQVQRAVEAAKAKPKNKQLVIEGSLGKISFSNAKTPKPLLNIKRPDSAADRPPSAHRKPSQIGGLIDQKQTLRDIENVYSVLLELESHQRMIPPPVSEESSPEQIQAHMMWRQKLQQLSASLWKDLKVMEPINTGSTTLHPFIAFLSHAKGKKAIPRIFCYIDEQQRITILTMIVVHLDALDVIARALPPSPTAPLPSTLPPAIREEVDLFNSAVMPPLFAYVNDAPLNIITGLLGLVLDRTNMANILRTKIGLVILTMLLSRAEILKQSLPPADPDWSSWQALFGRLFDAAEPVLPYIFPGSVNDADDVHVWQALAAIGVGATPEQQQRLVLGVKDRVMDTVGWARSLPGELKEKRLGDVNLFMRGIGLDVELLG